MVSIKCVILGSIAKEKGYDRAIEVIERNPNISLVVVGPLWAPAQQDTLNFLRRKEKELPNFRLDEKVLDEKGFEDYAKEADIILLPYQIITASGIFNQIIGSLKPIIAWDIPFFKEQEKKYGVCITVSSVKELEKKILKVYKSKNIKNKLKRGAKKMIKECSWEKVAKRYMEEYQSLYKK